jgi:hypothetical protein
VKTIIRAASNPHTHVTKFLSSLSILVALQIFLTGCAGNSSGHAPVVVKRGIQAVEAPASLQIKPEDHRIFVEKLESLLYAKDFYRAANDLTLRWQITKCHRGSRALRYLVGFGAGRAEMLVEAVVVDPKGKVIGNGVADGDQTMGVMGGSFASAVEEAAENTAEIARKAVYGH